MQYAWQGDCTLKVLHEKLEQMAASTQIELYLYEHRLIGPNNLHSWLKHRFALNISPVQKIRKCKDHISLCWSSNEWNYVQAHNLTRALWVMFEFAFKRRKKNAAILKETARTTSIPMSNSKLSWNETNTNVNCKTYSPGQNPSDQQWQTLQ